MAAPRAREESIYVDRYIAYDLFANLAKVRSNLEAGVYPGEYEFQAELYQSVFGLGHDGHFVFYPDALTKVFEYRRSKPIVSISEDGSSLPVIKLYGALLSLPMPLVRIVRVLILLQTMSSHPRTPPPS